MRILITGSGGFVAGSIIAQAPANHEIHGMGRSKSPENNGSVKYHKVDIVNESELVNVLGSINPNVVIHTAAIANIDYCENNRETAESINYIATKNISAICNDINAKLIFCSTDTVFDGRKGFYTEEDLPNGVNYYADTKIRAEQAVMAANPRNVVARLALVMGLPLMGKGNSFLADMIEKLGKEEELKFAVNEIRTPIDVTTLGAALLELATSQFQGLIHLAGNTRINRYEMARQIAFFAGFPDKNIMAINSKALQGRAPRPDDASLDNSKARTTLQTPMLSLQEGLAISLGRNNQNIKTMA
jgi:dTDP-4-dehydrorhamnose reductase